MSLAGPLKASSAKADRAVEAGTAGPSSNPLSLLSSGHAIRITQAGKMHAYVTHAVQHLQLHPEIPIVFHTLPTAYLPTSSTTLAESDPLPTALSNTSNHTRPPCLITIPKLISVLELVKRSYQEDGKAVADQAGAKEGKGKAEPGLGSRVGGGRLWQYNMSGTLEVLSREGGGQSKGKGKAKSQEDEAGELTELLKGNGHIRMSHSPYMVAAISCRPLTHLQSLPNVTYQAVPVPKAQRSNKRTRPQNMAGEEKAAKKVAVGGKKGKGRKKDASVVGAPAVGGDQGAPGGESAMVVDDAVVQGVASVLAPTMAGAKKGKKPKQA